MERTNDIEKLSIYVANQFEIGKSYGIVVSNKAFGKVILRDLLNKFDSYDILTIEPENNIGIAEVREVIDFLDFSPKGFAKIVVFFDAEKMTQEAANAFLKTLEEPPHYAILIMVTSRWHSLLPTIRSRLQRLYIRMPVDSNLDDFGKYLALWNYDFVEDLKNENYQVLSEEELFENDDVSDLTLVMSMKSILEEYRNKSMVEYIRFLQMLSKKNDMRYLRTTAKVVLWLMYKDVNIPVKSKIKYLRICDEIQRSKIANFNYQLTYYTLLLGLRGDNL